MPAEESKTFRQERDLGFSSSADRGNRLWRYRRGFQIGRDTSTKQTFTNVSGVVGGGVIRVVEGVRRDSPGEAALNRPISRKVPGGYQIGMMLQFPDRFSLQPL